MLVFVSHHGEDIWVARQMARAIEAVGGKAFLDEANHVPGQRFEAEIGAALGRAEELLVYMTPWAVARPWLVYELSIAHFRGLPITVVLHGVDAQSLENDAAAPAVIQSRACDLLALADFERYVRHIAAKLGAGS